MYAIYPDKEIYGIRLKPKDTIINTDITFNDVETCYKYPNEYHLIAQVGDADELIIGGYHAIDCVKRVAEEALKNDINCMVDLDLTDLFFDLYKQEDYFIKETYNPERFKHYVINGNVLKNIDYIKRMFNRNFDSPVYRLNDKNYVKTKFK